jgi:hypothetical protein
LFLYIATILIFALSAAHNKRDAIFLLLPILLLESTEFNIRFNPRIIFFTTLGSLAVGYLIIVLSIIRGYGEFKPKNFLDACKYVPDYVKSDYFIPSFMNNIEASYAYLHSNRAIEYIINNPNEIVHGKTLIKPLFAFIPRKFFPSKPESIIHLYTNTFSKEFRAQGGSWPISFQSEMFWNFHFFGIVFCALFFFIFNSVYLNILNIITSKNIINFIPLLYGYQLILTLVRGSGMDLFMVYFIFSSIFFFVLKFIVELLRKKAS